MKHWLFFLWLIISSESLLSQKRVKEDSSTFAIRSFDSKVLNKLKNQKDFQYTTSVKPASGLLDEFSEWLQWKIRQLFGARRAMVTFMYFLEFLAVAGFVFFLAKMLGMNSGGMFGRSARGTYSKALLHNDIHKIAFDDAIGNALKNGDYRLATRIQYLQALKKLSDNGYIDWRINKTNNDYLAEIRGKSFSDIFARLTYNFEYTWYGEKQVTKEHFSEIQRQFQHFNNAMQ